MIKQNMIKKKNLSRGQAAREQDIRVEGGGERKYLEYTKKERENP